MNIILKWGVLLLESWSSDELSKFGDVEMFKPGPEMRQFTA